MVEAILKRDVQEAPSVGKALLRPKSDKKASVDEPVAVKALRLNITLPPAATKRLERLQEVTEAASTAEIVRRALRLFAYLVDEEAKGNSILIEQKEGETVLLKII